MAFIERIAFCATSIREFIVPSYRPEQYYMRGPGPACARRLHATMQPRRTNPSRASFH